MEVICIELPEESKWIFCDLTLGKIYKVIRNVPENYQLIGDYGKIGSYSKEYFEKLKII